jgi:hypothetical protein
MLEIARTLWLEDHCAAKTRRVVSSPWSGVATGTADVNDRAGADARATNRASRENRPALHNRVDHATNASHQTLLGAFSVCVTGDPDHQDRERGFHGSKGGVMALGRQADTMLDKIVRRGGASPRRRTATRDALDAVRPPPRVS